MNCELCGKDANTYVILPIKKGDGSLITITCLRCAAQSPAYCRRHQTPHLGFAGDDTTACRLCIEEMVEALKASAGATYVELQVALSPNTFEEIQEAVAASSSITGDDEQISLLRFIVTKSLRTGKTIEEIVGELLQQNSAGVILR